MRRGGRASEREAENGYTDTAGNPPVVDVQLRRNDQRDRISDHSGHQDA
jgi:hypothetical protein